MDAEDDPDIINFVEYRRTDLAKAATDFWDSLDEAKKQEFLSVSPSDLAKFCSIIVQEPWLVDFLSDAVAFFELHGTWEMYLCPNQECLRLFQDDQSLIAHMKCEHFPQIHPVTWPRRRHILAAERWCADALHKMVWKPIVVEAALDLLSAMCFNYQHDTMPYEFAGSDWLYSLNWLYSEDPERKRLLIELEKEFQVLLAEHHQVSFSLLSDGYFSKMIALASKHIFDGCPPRFNTHLLQGLLSCSPLSFCLLKAADLSRFVEIVKTMSQFVKQHKLPSTNPELSDFVEGDISWSKSKIMDVLCFSSKESLFSFYEAEPLCSGDRISVLSLLCNGACIPSIPRVPSKAYVCFSSVQKVLDELRVPVKLDSIESFFQSEQNHLQLVNRVLCLESQLRKLCALDCRMYILPLVKSFLRLKLYFYLRFHRHKTREENPAVQLPMIPYLQDCTEQQVSHEESESDCDSDYDSDLDDNPPDYDSDLDDNPSDYDSDLDDKPWRNNPTLRTLDSTLSESATGESEGSGPFFWVVISDVLRHCEDHHGVGKSVQEGIMWFILYKTWKYWCCYTCGRKFIDQESHMVHLENDHQLCIARDEYWLIPQEDSRDDVEESKQDTVKRESALEDSITLDRTYSYFLVDSMKFYEIPSANEEGKLDQAKRTQYQEIVDSLENQLSHLKCLFEFKRENLKHLEFHSKDLEILKAVDQIDNMKLCLSNLCVCDYRTEFVPPVRSFLHAKFEFDNNLRSFECNNVKEFLSTPDKLLDLERAYSFKVAVLSPGKVIINAMEDKSSWAFAFIGIRLSFVGNWFGVAITGILNFGCWLSQCGGSSGTSVSVTPEDSAVISDWHMVESTLCDALSEGKLASLVYEYGKIL